jgi:hypothetical protein
MKKKYEWFYTCLVVVALVLLRGALVAHHGDAGRYDEASFTITGTIVEIRLVNPHSIIVFDAPDPKAEGKVVRWQAEMGGGQQLTRQFGWTKESPKVGDRITLTGRRVKSGAPYMNMTERANIVLTDTGKEIFRTQNFGQPPEQAK